MKALTKLRINEFVEMTDREMKHIVGGETTTTTSGTIPSRCDYKKCSSKSDCQSHQYCTTWSDCPDPTEGRCF